MDTLDTKHQSIRTLVTDVRRRLPGTELMVVDCWKADPYAIGLALRSHPERLAFVSRPPEFKGWYLLSCEFAARYDLAPQHNMEADPFSDLDALANTIAEHLNWNSPSLRSHLNSVVTLRFVDGEEVEALLLGADQTGDRDITYEVRRILKAGRAAPKGSTVGGTCVAPLKDLIDWSRVDA